MALELCRGLQASAVRQLLNSGGSEHGGSESGQAEDEMCTCLHPHPLGTEVEHTMVQACLWVAFAISVLILVYYAWCTYKGHCGWEEVYVCTVEMLKTIMEVFYETATPATILQFNGIHISWLRYAEWLLTCPVILIHLSNLTGLGKYNKCTMRLLVSDIGTIVCGVTAALCPAPAKIVFFLFGCCYGASTFITAAGVYISAYREVPKGECQTLVKACAWVFFTSWLFFPILFLMGPEGFGHLSAWGSIIAHTFADLMSKNLWGLLAHHLRNKIQLHIRKYGSIDAVPPPEEEEDAVHTHAHVPYKGKVSPPATPRAAAAAAKAAAGSDAIATITMSPRAAIHHAGSFSSSPTKAHASLGRSQSGSWAAGGPGDEPVRVLLGLPGEDAEAVLGQFQEQFATLPIAAEALPATSPAALLPAAANATAFGGADAVILHTSYLLAGGAGVARGDDLVGTLKELGLRVYVYGCDVGDPSEELSDVVGLLDGWIEGPSWAAPLNQRQLTALLLVLHAARNGSRRSSFQNVSRTVSPRSLSLQANSMGPMLRSRSTGNFSNAAQAGPVPMAISNRQSIDAGRLGVSPPNIRASFDTTWRGLSHHPQNVSNSAFNQSAQQVGSPNRTATGFANTPGYAPAMLAAPTAMAIGPAAPPATPAAPAATTMGAQQAAAGAAPGPDAVILQQLMSEISRLKSELSQGAALKSPKGR